MNERINKLDRLIASSWQEIKNAAHAKDKVVLQSTLDKISHLENLKQLEITLEKNIAASFSNDTALGKEARRGIQESNLTRSSERGKSSTVRPKEVRIGSYRKSTNYNNEIPLTVANWLIEQGVAIPILHNFVHPTNSGFASSAKTKQLTSGQWMEVGDDQGVLIQKGRKLLDKCGLQHQTFDVLLEDGRTLHC